MIGIICAMNIEAYGIIAACENIREDKLAGMTFVTGKIDGKEVAVAVCGVGKVNAAMCAVALIEKYHPDIVVNSGVAGALSSVVSIGDIVIGTKSVEHDMNTTALGDKQGEISFPDGKITYFECDKRAVELLEKACGALADTRVEKGVIASGDIFVSDRGKRMKINEAFGALACEMEGAAIGHVCCYCGVPYVILRAISDDLDDNKGTDFVKFCELACKKTVSAITAFIKAF